MSLSLWKKVLLLSVVASALGLLVAGSPLSIGQEKKAAEKKTEKAKGRLPAYYADVVSEEQKERIYGVQEKYAKELKALNEQLLAVTKKQNDEIEAVLTAEQKAQIDKARDAAIAKKKKKAADKKAAEAAPAATTSAPRPK
jgi:hypothetical protein